MKMAGKYTVMKGPCELPGFLIAMMKVRKSLISTNGSERMAGLNKVLY